MFKPPTLQWAFKEEQSVTPLVSSVFVRTLCSPHLCPSFFLISGARLSFRIPNFRDICVVHLSCSSRGGSCCTFVVCQSIQVCSHTTTLWFVAYSKIAESQYKDCLSKIHLSYFWEQCSMLVSPVLLVTQGILRPHCHCWDSGLLPHLSTFKWTSKGSDFALCWL